MEITEEVLRKAASAGITVLRGENTMVPGNLRADIAILEATLTAIASGALIVGLPRSRVESRDDSPENRGTSDV